MSDEKEKEQKTAPQMLLEELKSMKSMLESLKTGSRETQTKKEESVEAKGHKSLSEALDCPDCGGKTWTDVKESYGKINKKLEEERKDFLYQCNNCGLGVKADEPECIRCGSKKAVKR